MNGCITSHLLSPVGACDGWWCGAGKECEIGSDGLAKCGCIRECPATPPSSGPVCGTNGEWYENHCEIHRAACLSGDSELEIDHTNPCPKRKKKNKYGKTAGKKEGGQHKFNKGEFSKFGLVVVLVSYELLSLSFVSVPRRRKFGNLLFVTCPQNKGKMVKTTT